MAKKKKLQEEKAKRIFFIILGTWVAAVPAIIIFQLVMRMLFSSVDILMAVVNAISAVILLYGFFGWIPLIISAFYWESKK